MASAISSNVRVRIAIAGGQFVTIICRRPTAQAVSKFLDARFENKRNKIQSRLYAARTEFVRSIMVDIENAEYECPPGSETLLPLTAKTVLSDEEKAHWSGIVGEPVHGWKELIPIQWLSQAAQKFEDGQIPDDEEAPEKN